MAKGATPAPGEHPMQGADGRATRVVKPPRPGRPSRRLLLATGLYAACIAAILLSYAIGPERWSLTGLNLYLPQWIWALPGGVLTAWYFARARRWIAVPLVLLMLVFGPVMGLCLHFIHTGPPSVSGVRLRVMTYNVKWARRDAQAIENDIARYRPDLILMQDAGNTTGGELGRYLQGWNVLAVDQYVIASHLPLSSMDVRWISYPEHNHRVERCLLRAGGRDIVVYSCHLATPRWALTGMKHPRSGLATLRANLDFRVHESERLALQVLGETLPVVLCGDLNAPEPSLVCRHLTRAGLTDAFGAAGAGYGYTYGATTRLGHAYVRIDHIMVSHQWQVLNCWVGNAEGSDHRPVFADIYLPN
jgi:vancomycin resistance protein VanJ